VDEARDAADQAREATETMQDAAPGATGASEAASDALGSMASEVTTAGMERLDEMKTQLLERTVGALGGITDVATATAALPNLEDVAANAGAITERLATLGGGVMRTLAPANTAALDEQVTRLDAMPEVKAVIEKPLAAIVSFFKG
jgi:hypothetical protein